MTDLAGFKGSGNGKTVRDAFTGARPIASSAASRRSATHTFALVFSQIAFAKADVFWRDLNELVIGDELHGLLKAVQNRRRQKYVLITA